MPPDNPIKVFYPFPEDPSVHRARTIQALNTAASLARAGAEVTLFLDGKKEGFEELLSSYYGIRIPRNLNVEFSSREKMIMGVLPMRSNRLFNSRFIRMAKGLASPDAIFCRHLKTAEFLLKERPFRGVPVVFEAHDIFHLSFQEENSLRCFRNRMKHNRLKRRETFVLNNADAIISITSHLLERMRGEFGVDFPENIAPDGTAFAGLFEEKKLDLSDNRIFYIGSFQPWKGVNLLIEALKYPGMGELVLVGPMNGREKEELSLISKRLGVLNKVSFRGPAAPSGISSLLKEVNFVAVPNGNDLRSRLFTSPLKLFDYMAAGAAIIASDHPSIREVLGEEKIGWAKPGDPASIAGAFRRLKENPGETIKTSLSLKKMALDYSWDRRGERILEILSSLCAR